jgi:uncharacterized membrane protein YeaQ/YmgE (transglycosylase-associated protein family)
MMCGHANARGLLLNVAVGIVGAPLAGVNHQSEQLQRG